MTSQYEMQFPFTTQKEILHWRRAILKIYLSQPELRQIAKWKDRFVPSKIDKNPPGLIGKITGEAFGFDDDWEKIKL